MAIHNYTLNHPLDYPDDDVNQRGKALTEADYDAEGAWAWDNMPMDTINAWRWQDKNPGDTILDDASCFRSFEFFNAQVVRALGLLAADHLHRRRRGHGLARRPPLPAHHPARCTADDGGHVLLHAERAPRPTTSPCARG